MAYFLGVDAGGTKTSYALAEDGRELARVRGGTLKRLRVDAATAAGHLEAALAALTLQTGVPLGSITATCVGIAGVTVPLVADWVREAMAFRVGGRLEVVGDVDIALDAAFPGGPGVLVMAGTGSNVAGRSAAGAVMTAGGWGPALADQASGHRIGSEALRDLFLALDEGRPTTLLNAVLEAWDLRDVEALVAFANGSPAPPFSALAPVVSACAESGDAVARALLVREGEALAGLAKRLLGRLQAEDGPIFRARVAMTGSILEQVPGVRGALEAALQRAYPEVELRAGVVDPVAGALWQARKL